MTADELPQPIAILEVRAKPHAARPGLIGWHAGALKVGLRAAPERGRANDELIALLAAVLHLATSRITLVRGAASQNKRVRIEGLDFETLRRRIDAALTAE